MDPFPKAEGCRGCPYEHRGIGYCRGEGPTDARLAILGQSPGQNEVYSGTPFFDAPGRAGWRLNRQLEWAGIDRRTCWVDNVVRCWIRTKGDDVVPARAIRECWTRHVGPPLHRLEQHALRRGEPLWVAWVGTPAMKLGLGPWANATCTGALISTALPEVTHP